MANLYGTLQSERTGKSTRTANLIIEATARSYEGSISVSLNASGTVQIKVAEGSVASPTGLILYTTLEELLNLSKKGNTLKLTKSSNPV